MAPVRRSFHAAFDVAKKLEKQCDFFNAKSVQSHGMMLRTKLREFSAAVKWLVALDRHEFVERERETRTMRRLRTTAMMFGDVLWLYVLCTILKKNGEKTQNEDQRKERWQQHWAEVFQSSIIEFHRCRSAQGGSHEHCPDLDLSPEAMEVSIARCRRHKATGRDILTIQRGDASG